MKEIKSNIDKTKENRLKATEEIYNIHHETREIYNKLNNNLADRVKNSFLNEFDLASRHIIENELKFKTAEEKNYEYSNLIQELEIKSDQLICDKKLLEEHNTNLKSEYDFLKEGYEDCIKDNSNLRNEIQKKDERIQLLEGELNDMKNVVAKLTEIRVILNKYFSNQFENFTPQEKKIIQDVDNTNNHKKQKILNE